MRETLKRIEGEIESLSAPLERKYREGILTDDTQRTLLRELWQALYHISELLKHIQRGGGM